MPTNGLKIGIIGGYVSGKATFLNALLKTSCFRMRSNTHNHVIVQIQAGEKNVEWNYMEMETQDWKKSRVDIRFSKTYQRIQAKVPRFLWGNTVFYDFPQINDVALWKKGYNQEVASMDDLICVLDAEYLLSETNKKILATLARHNLSAVILNKCDRIDEILGLKTQLQELCPNEFQKFRVFTVSSDLELQRWMNPEERIIKFAFTESRDQAMRICDLAFSDLRVWLYELINYCNCSTPNKKEK